ncbi:TetR family transcriptional regulator [Enterococcus florum]|uniref:TetR family transcriptional regulator n=1 Tax=Enterococcus florum TaxID=2480627 RepID=A0A4P5P8I9_9ENTE|nr:TetR/AcrR family transcriptional regulator [Enterococcus florum]GCF94160.1 TetR family transcriptional regulator [Enterococcus florum]
MTDRRKLKTQKAIHQAFIELLKEKPLNKITVAELSERADLGRGTFYLHYKDTYDLYEQLEEELYAELVELFEQYTPYVTAENLRSLMEAVATYIEGKKELFLLLMQSNANGNVLYKIKEIFKEKVLQDECYQQVSTYDQIEALFIVSGMIGVLEEWLTSELELSLKQVFELLHRLLVKFDCS